MNLDFSKWHPGCTRMVVGSSEGLYIVCMTCGVACNLEGISAKVSAVDACRIGSTDRVIVGKQTIGLDKGGAK